MGNFIVAEIMQKEINKDDRVLDLGVGKKPFKKFIQCESYYTVDAWPKAKPDLILDVEKNKLPFKKSSFDICIMIDFIEHLTKKRGFSLIEELKNIITKKILVFTPLFWECVTDEIINDPTFKYHGDEFIKHRSLWKEEDFKGWDRYSSDKCGKFLIKYYYGKWERK